jgi:hypothetical protein
MIDYVRFETKSGTMGRVPSGALPVVSFSNGLKYNKLNKQ